jgi:Ankyrin repeats (3 copies)
MANVFIHFEPIGPIGGQVKTSGDLPPYVIPGSLSEPEWRRNNPKGHRIMGKHGSFTTGSTELHHDILEGRIDDLRATLDKHAHLINVRDKNGWTPLHEAARKGEIDAIELLLNRGAEVNARTGSKENGDSPLALAKQYHGPDHEVTKLLEARGAKEYKYSSEL